MSDDVLDCARIAYVGGLAAGLSQALAGTDVVAAAPGRYVVVPVVRVRPDMQVVPHPVAAAEGICLVRVPRTGPAVAPDGLGLRLAGARLGLTHRIADAAVGHQSTRTSGGEPLLRKQLVRGEVADVVTGMEALRRQLVTAGARPAQESIVDIHDRIDELDWRLAMLFGASGYLAADPARALYVSGLVSGAWISREAYRVAA